jgi:hypothetical protein
MRVALLTVMLTAAAWIATPVPTAAQAAQAAWRYHGPIWQFGVLESVAERDGWALVFCEATVDGCTERVIEAGDYSRQTAVFPDSRQEPSRRGRYDLHYARALAKLGRDGWELVAEGVSGVPGCETCRVLHFKRLVGSK